MASLPSLPKGTHFTKGPYPKKYTAHIPNGKGKVRKVSFGHQDYQQYRDSVPPSLGGGLWSNKNHLDPARRTNYRRRHGAQGYYRNPYTPAWFSYYFLW